ncbi:hypothetical protein SAMN04487761_12236 [Lachnospiraceae bacterium C7]|nr:hypothetical protein SAMN04487761_12236 [Lachnospiraceae bacterium C7]
MLRRLNDSLPGLISGIIVYGVIIQLIGVWFVEDKVSYSIGLWYGAVIASWLAINIAQVIRDAVDLQNSDKANRKIIAKSLMRYIVVVILFSILGYFKFGNLFMAFVGVMGLKISAYAQPITKKLINKLLGRSDASVEEENSEKLDKEVTL